MISVPRVMARTARVVVGGMLLRGVGHAQGWDEFRLRSWSGELRLLGEYRDESRGTGTGTLEEEERLLREELMLELLGSYYHERFLDYRLRGVLGLEQRDTDTNDASGTTDVDREHDGWDARLRFFKEHPYSGDLYSYRRETTSRQTFLGTTDALTTESGLDLRANEWWIPSRLHAHRFEYEGRGFDTFQERRDNVLIEGQRSGERSDLRYSADTSDVRIDSTGQSYTDRGASAGASLFFGEDRSTRWSNDARWREQEGSLDTSNENFSSLLHERWSDTLDSDHRLLLSRAENAGASSDTLTLGSDVTHRLFESLTSTLSGSLGTSEVGSGTVDDEGLGARFAYRKKVPFGVMRLDWDTDVSWRDQSGLEDAVPVLDEPQVLSFGTPAFLDELAVVPGSIQVTDVTGATLYAEGLDYLVTVEGSRTRLELALGSAIVSGDTVLVDYSFQPAPDLEFRDLTQRFGVGFALGEVADLDLSLASTRQDRVSGTDTGTLQDTDRLRGNLRVFPLGARRGAELGAEYEDYEADFGPYERTGLSASYRLDDERGGGWWLAANVFRTHFPDDDADERGRSLTATWRRSLDERASLDLRGEWHAIDYRADEGDGWLVDGRYVIGYQKLEFALTLRLSDEEFEVASDQRVVALLASVARRF